MGCGALTAIEPSAADCVPDIPAGGSDPDEGSLAIFSETLAVDSGLLGLKEVELDGWHPESMIHTNPQLQIPLCPAVMLFLPFVSELVGRWGLGSAADRSGEVRLPLGWQGGSHFTLRPLQPSLVQQSGIHIAFPSIVID